MPLDPALYRELDSIISQEIAAHREYLSVIEKERALVVEAKSADLSALTQKREALLSQMQAGQEMRFALMRRVLGQPDPVGRRKAPPPQMKLSQFIEHCCSAPQRRALLPKLNQLRTFARDAQGKSREFAQTVSFSLQMVSGLVSILWSATKNVVRSYTPAGSVKESVHDAGSRKAGLLKEA